MGKIDESHFLGVFENVGRPRHVKTAFLYGQAPECALFEAVQDHGATFAVVNDVALTAIKTVWVIGLFSPD